MPTLDFKGKQYVHSHHLSVPFRALEIDAAKSLSDNPSLDDNLIIHGDNLHALKALMPKYAGKVKCIYIDPPYNTGNEGWCYNDNVNSPQMQEWLKKNANPVDKEDMQRHDKWLCMMWPRLQLLRELLADDGVIFVSIDDEEQARLKMIMDEIFGEENFISNVVWQKKYSPQNDAKWFSDNHDFIVCYGKKKEIWRPNQLARSKEAEERYKNPDNDSRGVWKPMDMSVKTFSDSGNYTVITPSGRKVTPPKSRCWAYSETKFHDLVKDNRIWFGKDGQNVPSIKGFLSEIKDGVTPLTLWTYQEVGHNQTAKKELKNIFDQDERVFDTPKPTTLIDRILQIATDKDSIILDSFAGSGTTAHAVLNLNKEDGGNRKFILVEMEDYASDVTAERVRRVIKGVPTAKDEKLKEGLGGSFTFAELGEAFDIDKILTGESLPAYNALAQYVFYTATGESLKGDVKPSTSFYVGESSLFEVYLIYQPDLAFLRSNDSALNQEKLDIITAKKSTKQKLVFATAKYMSQSALTDNKVVFCQIPYAIHKIAGN